MDELFIYFKNMKKISHPPYKPSAVSQHWRNCSGSSSNSKTIYPTPHLYRPVSQLSEVSIPLLYVGDIVRMHQKTLCVFTCMTMKWMWRNGVENPLLPYSHGYVICKEGQSRKGIRPGKYLLQLENINIFLPVGSLQERGEGLILFLSSIMSLLGSTHEKWVMNTITSTGGALPPVRWRKETITLDLMARYITATRV